MEPRPKKLLDQVREAIRLKHYSYRTEQSYVAWIRRYIRFHYKRHPKEMGSAEIESFLTHLAVQEQVSASTQNQALSALLFLYQNVLHQELDRSVDAVPVKRSQYLPTGVSISGIWNWVMVRFICRLPWSVSTLMQIGSGSGSLCFPQPVVLAIHAQVLSVDIICMKRESSDR
jgi:hypothetical protein